MIEIFGRELAEWVGAQFGGLRELPQSVALQNPRLELGGCEHLNREKVEVAVSIEVTHVEVGDEAVDREAAGELVPEGECPVPQKKKVRSRVVEKLRPVRIAERQIGESIFVEIPGGELLS